MVIFQLADLIWTRAHGSPIHGSRPQTSSKHLGTSSMIGMSVLEMIGKCVSPSFSWDINNMVRCWGLNGLTMATSDHWLHPVCSACAGNTNSILNTIKDFRALTEYYCKACYGIYKINYWLFLETFSSSDGPSYIKSIKTLVELGFSSCSLRIW